MRKRGQISIFMLFAIIITILIALVFMINPSISPEIKKSTETSINLLPIENYFDTCIESIGEDSLILFGLQGGNMEIVYVDDDPVLFIKAYYEYGKNAVPTLQKLEQTYSEYLEESLPSCLDEVNFPGYEIILDDVNVNAKFHNDFVDVNVDFPLTIISGNTKTKSRNFNQKYPIRMGHIHNLSLNIVNRFVLNPGRIEYSYLAQFEENDFFIMPYNESLFTVTIQDDKSIIGNKKYNFVFGLLFEESKDEVKEDILNLLR